VAGLFLPTSAAMAISVLAVAHVGPAIAAAAVGASVARGVVGPARLSAAALGTLGALTAGLVARAFAITDALAFLPSGLQALAAGATSGLVVGVSSIGRHARLERTPLPPLEDELRAMSDGSELGQLLGRAAVAYREAVAAIGSEAPAARVAADELVSKMTRFGRRWRELEAEAARALPAELNDRLLLVGRKLETTVDPLARAEFARAREALGAQAAYLDEIASGRERAVARLTHQVATLERLRLAALRHRSADATRLGAELAPVVDELAQAGGDFDIATEALSEATVAGALQAPQRSLS
jgi:hypothetical protein